MGENVENAICVKQLAKTSYVTVVFLMSYANVVKIKAWFHAKYNKIILAAKSILFHFRRGSMLK